MYPEGDAIVMVVGGPNARKDFHINETPEFFYQIEGDVEVEIYQDGKRKAIPIREGDVFLLPANVPHSPKRPANTIGLVLEQKREASQKDGFLWICDKCDAELYRHHEHIFDIVAQLPKIFDAFYNDADKTTCKSCGHKATRSQ